MRLRWGYTQRRPGGTRSTVRHTPDAALGYPPLPGRIAKPGKMAGIQWSSLFRGVDPGNAIV
jgi:hypothetical protein